MLPRKTFWPPVRTILSSCALALTLAARAHDPGLSTATLRIEPCQIDAVVVLSAADAGTILNLDKIRHGWSARDGLVFASTSLQAASPGPLQVQLNDQTVEATGLRCAFDNANNVTVSFSFPKSSAGKLWVRSPWLALLPPGHRQYFTIKNSAGEALAEQLFSATENTAMFELPAANPHPRAATRTATVADFLALGVKHIWTGYDHLLFLFGLMVVTRNAKAALQLITCFTVAHSFTLAIATLNLVQISSRVVEPLIAASIVYVGIENLFSRGEPKGRWLLTFVFGLVHGFGFATVLRELGVGANGSGIAVPLISFNLGVELGQLTIAMLALPVI